HRKQTASGRTYMRLSAMAAAFALLGAAAGLAPAQAQTHAQGTKIASEDISVPHGEGVKVFVRNKRPEGVASFGADRIVVMMHGATYPSTSFDLPVAGKSWMEYIAERGYDVYALDLPGYGRSTRPTLMDAPADQNPPFMGTA